MSEQPYCVLSVHVEDGHHVLRDDRGLKVRGVRMIETRQEANQVTFVTVKLVSGLRGPHSMLKGGHMPPEAVRQLVAEIGEEVRDGAKLDLK
jgi:hypothetical protein